MKDTTYFDLKSLRDSSTCGALRMNLNIGNGPGRLLRLVMKLLINYYIIYYYQGSYSKGKVRVIKILSVRENLGNFAKVWVKILVLIKVREFYFQIVTRFFVRINPLSPKSDQHQISPHNVRTLS